MTFRQYRYLVLADLYRIGGRCDRRTFWRQLTQGEGFRFLFWMRTCRYTRQHPVLRFLVYPLARTLWRHYTYKFGLSIPYTTEIGPGLFIGHFGGVVVSCTATLGRDVNISQGVTIGRANRGRRKGAPVLGDRVYLGPGVKVVGAVTLGSDVAVGANCVIVDDVPDHGVVVGIPGKVISDEGAEGYVEHTDYERVLGPWPA
jgi:serine O-acetyltransferase